MFSAFFAARPERMTFMSDVHAALPEDFRIVLFNLAESVESECDVVNAMHGFRPVIEDPLAQLEEELREAVPDEAGTFLAQARGEFDNDGHPDHGDLVNLIFRLRAFRRALEDHAPGHVFLWNQFNVFHRIAAAILSRQGIGVGFFHDGLLPGSIALDFDGEMGNSWIARQPERFQQVAVSQDDLLRAEAFLEGLTGEEVNRRHLQRENILVHEALQQAGLSRRPVLFFAGQNDWHGGIKPTGPETARHSPVFDGSAEALRRLDSLAGEIGFSVLYKPHPLSRDRFLFLQADAFPNSMILKSTSLSACMEASQLVSTIASQTCYVALLDGRPVMMLGRNQISGKGLTYDVHTLEDLPGMIERGMSDPLAGTRRTDLIRHVAQLERCYLLDYGTMPGGFYRRGAASMARALQACLEHGTEEVIEMQIAGELN